MECELHVERIVTHELFELTDRRKQLPDDWRPLPAWFAGAAARAPVQEHRFEQLTASRRDTARRVAVLLVVEDVVRPPARQRPRHDDAARGRAFEHVLD